MLDFLMRAARLDSDPLQSPEVASRWLANCPPEQTVARVSSAVAAWLRKSRRRDLAACEALLVLCQGSRSGYQSLCRDYLAGELTLSADDAELRTRLQEYQRCLVSALDALPDRLLARKDALAMLLDLLLDQALWCYFRHQRTPAGFWLTAHRAYRLAEAAALHQLPMSQGEATLEHRYLQLQLMSLLSGGNLTSRQLLAASQLLQRMPAMPALSHEPQRGGFAVYLIRDVPPMRVLDDEGPSDGARFWHSGPVMDSLALWRDALEADMQLPILASISHQSVLTPAFMRQLGREWTSMRRFYRRAERVPLSGRVDVIARLAGIHQLLSHDGEHPAETDSVLGWDGLNRSDSGVGVILSGPGNNWVRLGRLLAYRTGPGEAWHIGMVRRIRREAMYRLEVGIERMPRPVAVTLRPLPGDGWLAEMPAAMCRDEGLIALLIHLRNDAYRGTAIVLPRQGYQEGRELLLNEWDGVTTVQLGRLLEQESELVLAELR